MRNARPLIDYLSSSTTPSLESFELAHLNASSNTRKKLLEILDQYFEQEVNARVARWILEYQSARPPQAVPRAHSEPVRHESNIARPLRGTEMRLTEIANPIAVTSSPNRHVQTASDLLLFPDSQPFGAGSQHASLLSRVRMRKTTRSERDDKSLSGTFLPTSAPECGPNRKRIAGQSASRELISKSAQKSCV
jgi:hypothetical protein